MSHKTSSNQFQYFRYFFLNILISNKLPMAEGKQGRRELLEVIAQQKEQLSRYETRLKDVVRAYKGLAKEKETLESSLSAITAAVNEEKEAEHETEKNKTDTEDGGETDTESIAESVSSDVTSASESIKPKAKLAALSSSLASLAGKYSL